MRIQNINKFYVVPGLVILAALLRLPTLGSPLMEDEAIMFSRYSGLPWDTLLLKYDTTNQHTLYLLLSDFCISLFGKNEIAFRLPSFLAGLFAVVLIYRTGAVLLPSRASSVAAALLLCFSATHLKYSQEGRGYALTVFLALLITLLSLRSPEAPWGRVWGAVLAVSGFLMVLALPTNLFFLITVAALFSAALWLNDRGSGSFFERDVIRRFVPFIAMFALVGAHLYIIRGDLFFEATLQSQEINYFLLSEVAILLVSPWGLWMYFAVALGAWNLIQEKRALSFAIIFLVPIVLTLVTGIVGFPRVYLYWLPFILLLAAHGMVSLVTAVRKSNVVAGHVLTAVFVLVLIAQPVNQLATYYSLRVAGAFTSNGPNPAMAEAEQMANYVEENISEDHLILVMASGPESSVLNHYLGERVRRSMIRFANGERLKKIILICHKDVPPQKYKFIMAVGAPRLVIPDHLATLIKTIGNLRIFDLDLRVSRLMPQDFDPDYDAGLESRTSEKLFIESVDQPRVIGRRLLAARNRTSQALSAVSPVVKAVNNLGEDTFVLTVYITLYGERALAILADKDRWPPAMGYLNYYLGMFKLPGSDLRWQVVYLLSHLKKGENNLREILQVQGGQTFHLDGLQSFILSR